MLWSHCVLQLQIIWGDYHESQSQAVTETCPGRKSCLAQNRSGCGLQQGCHSLLYFWAVLIETFPLAKEAPDSPLDQRLQTSSVAQEREAVALEMA